MELPTLTVTVSGEKAKSLIATAVADPWAGDAGAAAAVVALVLLESDATPRPIANAAAPMVTTAAATTAMRGRPATPGVRTGGPIGSVPATNMATSNADRVVHRMRIPSFVPPVHDAHAQGGRVSKARRLNTWHRSSGANVQAARNLRGAGSAGRVEALVSGAGPAARMRPPRDVCARRAAEECEAALDAEPYRVSDASAFDASHTEKPRTPVARTRQPKRRPQRRRRRNAAPCRASTDCPSAASRRRRAAASTQLVMSLVEKLAHARPRNTTMYAAWRAKPRTRLCHRIGSRNRSMNDSQ